MSETYTYTLNNALMTEGTTNDLVTGTWTATYNAAGQLVSVTNINITVEDTADDQSTTFTSLESINQGINPGTGGQYEIQLGGSSGGPFTGFYLDWLTETPTSLISPAQNSTHYSSIQEWNGSGFTDLTLNPNALGNISSNPCYCAGTRILTKDGEVLVENLAVGQLLVTASGDAKPIRWIGHRRIDLSRHPEPDMVRPVRIAAGAFAEGVPARDLLVSPDHAMLVDGALIPARLLVNHRSITLEHDVAAVTYYHVELDRHDIIIAEGAQAETYLDTDNRALFENGAVTLLTPDFSVGQRLRVPADGACMPLVTDTAGVLPVWQRLADRAGAVAPDAEADAMDGGVRLIVGGREVLPVVEDGDRLVFAMPRAAGRIRIRSAAMRPNQARPWLDDRRMLGVAVKALSADQKAIPLDGPAFGTGWWDIEHAGSASFRWSNGDASLDLPAGTRLLTIRLHASMVGTGPVQSEAA
jgi:YD repeat-containing protein